MRSLWLTGWLLLALLVCSGADPRSAVAEAPAAPASPRHGSPASPATPDSSDARFRHIFTTSGYARAQRLNEISAGWSTRRHLLVHAVELADLTARSARRASAAILCDAVLLRDAGRVVFVLPSLADSPSPPPACDAHAHPHWLQAMCASSPAPLLGIAMPVAWLIRRRPTPASSDHDRPAPAQ